MTAIDATGLHALEKLCDRLKKSGRTLLLCGARRQPAEFIRQAEFVEHIGRENILPHVEAALQRAQRIYADFAGVGEEVAHDMAKTRL
jgi:SulP family sulfate permease